MGFHSIHPAPGLSDRERDRVNRVGPPAVSTRGLTNREMVERAGFVGLEERDVTAEYLQTLRAKISAEALVHEDLCRLYGEDEYATTVANRHAAVDVIEAGLLRRSLVICRTPHPG